MSVSHPIESEVRSYSRSFPEKFDKAKGSSIYGKDGTEYIDFFSGAGSLNYGHNNDSLKKSVIEYLESDGILHGLDMSTEAKSKFLDSFQKNILEPRNLNYKVQFPGPTGTNAVEAALKIAKKYTGRQGIVSFTNGFHGMTMGSLAVTGNQSYRENIGYVDQATFMPFANYFGEEIDTIDIFRKYLEDKSSGLDIPAAVIVETIQGEGGVNVADKFWLSRLSALCKEYKIVMIVDDIQVGCGRTGDFFSFEFADIKPDIVTLSKSISGFGLPMSLVLINPDLDCWKPGEHNGTFRGNNLAFISAAKTIDTFWSNSEFSKSVKNKSKIIVEKLEKVSKDYPELDINIKGRGMMLGIDFSADTNFATNVQKECFKHNLIIETSGSEDQILKLLPALTIDEDKLVNGLNIIVKSIETVYAEQNDKTTV